MENNAVYHYNIGLITGDLKLYSHIAMEPSPDFNNFCEHFVRSVLKFYSVSKLLASTTYQRDKEFSKYFSENFSWSISFDTPSFLYSIEKSIKKGLTDRTVLVEAEELARFFKPVTWGWEFFIIRSEGDEWFSLLKNEKFEPILTPIDKFPLGRWDFVQAYIRIDFISKRISFIAKGLTIENIIEIVNSNPVPLIEPIMWKETEYVDLTETY